MRLTNKTHYGFQLLTYLAKHHGEWFPLSHLATELNLPLSFLKHVASALKRHKILESQGGIHGGYRLERSPSDITLAMVMKALNEPIRLVPCKARQCSHQKCITGGFWEGVSGNIMHAFEQTTLETMAKTSVLSS